MIKQGGNFFLQHLEKIILPVVGLACLWLLITQVLISSEYAEYDGRKFSPDRIDGYIKTQAESLQARMQATDLEDRQSPDPHYEEFVSLVNSAINIDPNVNIPMPFYVSEDVIHDKQYHIPDMGSVNDIDLEHIRAVAYVPTVVVDQDNPYESAENEPNDVDLVTVSAKFSLAELYENLYQNYAGESVKADWRDPCLAEPVFAAVQLQRQKLVEGENWSQWQDVPRTKIDHQSKLLEVIEDIGKLPRGGLKVRMLLFDNMDVTKNILRPRSYQIASADEDWFPPELHREFLKYKKLEKEARRREARQARVKEREDRHTRERTRPDRGERSSRTRSTRTSDMGMGDLGGPPGPGGGGSGGRTATSRTRLDRSRDEEDSRRNLDRRRDEGSIDDVYKKYEELLISEEQGLSALDNEFIFWAHDDTVQPGKIYRYRIRLGIFNPLAGTNKFAEPVKEYKDRVILWTDFSDVSSSVEIPAKLYFFPTDMQKAANAVKVDVFKYTLGYWYGEQFSVKQGEAIGSAKPTKEDEDDDDETENLLIPENVDYSTGAIFVDTSVVNDWAGGRSLSPREYFAMYYSYDGTDLKNTPIGQKYWAYDRRTKYNGIQSAMKQPKEPLRPWSAKTGRGGIRRSTESPFPGMDGPSMFEGMMP